jgi:hypothetical protein
MHSIQVMDDDGDDDYDDDGDGAGHGCDDGMEVMEVMAVMAVTVMIVIMVMAVMVVMIVMVLDMNILDSHMASLNFIWLFDTCCIPGSNTMPLTSLSRNSPPLSTVFFCCVWVCA